jgi:hypothetical protein
MTDKELMQQALEALESNHDEIVHDWSLVAKNNKAITALRTAIEQAEKQEPVAYVYEREIDGFGLRKDVKFLKPVEVGSDLYTSPPASRPLTERELMKCIADAGCFGTVKMSFESGPYDIDRPSLNADKLCRAIEAAHGITGETK